MSKILKADHPTTIKLPGFIKLFLSIEDQEAILNEWIKRYKEYEQITFAR